MRSNERKTNKRARFFLADEKRRHSLAKELSRLQFIEGMAETTYVRQGRRFSWYWRHFPLFGAVRFITKTSPRVFQKYFQGIPRTGMSPEVYRPPSRRGQRMLSMTNVRFGIDLLATGNITNE